MVLFTFDVVGNWTYFLANYSPHMWRNSEKFFIEKYVVLSGGGEKLIVKYFYKSDFAIPLLEI